jgi:uncharacterized protein (TIGR00369 family)
MHTEPVPNQDHVRESFHRQGLMQTIGATLTRVGRGEAAVSAPYSERLTQQNGFLHAGVITTLLDTACGYAAMSTAPAGYNPLAVEFKVNLLAPARGVRFEARASDAADDNPAAVDRNLSALSANAGCFFKKELKEVKENEGDCRCISLFGGRSAPPARARWCKPTDQRDSEGRWSR